MIPFRVIAGSVAAAALAVACSPAENPPPSPPEHERLPTVALLYQNVPDTAALKPVGKVDVVVVPRQSSESQAVKAIHQHGADAYRYFQSYWFPADRDYDGLTIGKRKDIGFCTVGETPLVGRTQGESDWLYLDANERAAQAWFKEQLGRLKRAGYDGIMFDRGYAALTGIDPSARAVWNKTSTCTEDPVVAGATFADAYVSLMKTVHESGLKLFQNYGKSPFDPTARFRPVPSDPNCNPAALKTACKRTTSGMDSVDFFLDEAVAHPQDTNWDRDYDANRQNEKDTRFGGRVVGLITQGTLGGSSKPQDVVFQYARVRIFNLPVAIFTGYDKCKGRSDFCNRLGTYPRLAQARWGEPLTGEPQPLKCETGSDIHCLWVRQYERGVVAVNNSGRTVVARVPLKRKLCGPLVDLASGARQASACHTTLRLKIPAWSGQLTYSAKG